jgi:flagellar biosynthesis protein FliR
VIEAFLSRALLVAIRVGGLMTFAPFFGNAALPIQVKGTLTLLLTVLLLPVYAAAGVMPAEAATASGWIRMAMSEAAIGLMTGLATQFVFDGLELAGQIVGFQFGFSLVNVIDPNSQVEITVLATFYEFVALLIFMVLGVQRWLLRAVSASFLMIPPGTLAVAQLPVRNLLKASGSMWLVGAEVAFPVLLATMVVDLAIGFVSKASPQIPAMFFGISVKVLLGLGLLYGTSIFWPRLFENYFFHALANLQDLLTIAR